MIFTLIIFRINFSLSSAAFCLSVVQVDSSFFVSFFYILFCNWFLFIDLACSGYTLTHTDSHTDSQELSAIRSVEILLRVFGFGVVATRKFRFFLLCIYF